MKSETNECFYWTKIRSNEDVGLQDPWKKNGEMKECITLRNNKFATGWN